MEEGKELSSRVDDQDWFSGHHIRESVSMIQNIRQSFTLSIYNIVQILFPGDCCKGHCTQTTILTTISIHVASSVDFLVIVCFGSLRNAEVGCGWYR